MTYRMRIFFLIGAVGLLLVSGAEEARAGGLIVGSTDDSGPLTLRQAIQTANSSGGADVITFDPAVFPPGNPATITLTDALPEIKGSGGGVTIDGANAGVIVDGSSLADDASGLVVTSGNSAVSNVTIAAITVQGFPGDGILVCGGELPACTADVAAVEISGVTVSDNGPTGVHMKGNAVHDVDFVDCDIIGNGKSGLDIRSQQDASRIMIEGCAVDNNGDKTPFSQDTGVYVESDGQIVDFTLRDSSVSGNGALGMYLSSVEETVRPVIDNVDAIGNGAMGIGFSSAQPLTDLLFVDSAVDGNGSRFRNGLGTEVLAFQIVDATITGNSFSNNMASNPIGGVGFQVYSQFERPSGLTITNNVMNGNVGPGVVIITDTPGNEPVDASVISENEVSGNSGDGVTVIDSRRIRISRNWISGNGDIGIDLAGGPTNGVTPNDAGDGDDGSNDFLNFPVINGVAGDSVVGTACGGCSVELFVSDDDASGHGEGAAFIGETVAGGGSFSIEVCGVSAGGKVTATATDSSGNTSEFSANYVVPFDTEPCAGQHRKQGDADCDNDVDGRDAIVLGLNAAGLALLSRGAGCPALGVGAPAFGDLNCDGMVDARDMLGPLAFLADFGFAQTGDCVELGNQL